MTLTKFYRLYNAYKMTFDMELKMKLEGKTYSGLEREPTIDDIL